MEESQTELTQEQKEKLLHHTCQTAVMLNYLQELEEKIVLESDLQNEVALTSYAVHTVKVKLMGLVVD